MMIESKRLPPVLTPEQIEKRLDRIASDCAAMFESATGQRLSRADRAKIKRNVVAAWRGER